MEYCDVVGDRLLEAYRISRSNPLWDILAALDWQFLITGGM